MEIMQNWCTNNAKNCVQGILVGDFPHMVIKAYENIRQEIGHLQEIPCILLARIMHFVLDGIKIIRVYMNIEVMIAVIKIRLSISLGVAKTT